MEYSIGTLAKSANLNVETIRYYQRRGLLDLPVRPMRGHRTYGENHLKALKLIAQSKSLGFTLKEIAELLSLLENQEMSCGQLTDRAREKHKAIESKINGLKKIQESLQKVIDICACKPNECPCPKLDSLPDLDELVHICSSNGH